MKCNTETKEQDKSGRRKEGRKNQKKSKFFFSTNVMAEFETAQAYKCTHHYPKETNTKE
jgi:hypothetical protein